LKAQGVQEGDGERRRLSQTEGRQNAHVVISIPGDAREAEAFSTAR
jgi:hypothetical protein